MAVKLRLARHGSKARPYYRIVAAVDQARRDGRFLEQLGTYDPAHEPPAITLQRERIHYWLGVGARPTGTVNSIFKRYLDGEDTVVHAAARRRPTSVAPAAPAAAAAKAPAAPAAAAAKAAEPAPAPEAAAEETAQVEAQAAEAAASSEE